MNITFLKLYITNELSGSFYNSQEIGLAKAVTEAYPQHRVSIVLLSRSESRVEQITDRVTLHVVKAKGLGHHGIIDLSLLKELKTDLVHLLADNMLYAPNVIRYCRRNGIKCQLYIGTLFTDNNKWYRKALDRLLMSRNISEYRKSAVYVKTPAVQKQCKELGIKAELAPVGLNKEDVIPSEKAMPDIRQQYGIPEDKQVLLFVGRLEEYKHPLDAVEVLGKLELIHEKKHSETLDANVLSKSNYHLVMVGSGSLDGAIKSRISEYGLGDSVTFLPRVPNTEMKHLYKACDYFVNFNPDEIYGMSILEAMAHGCPVFAISAPGPEFLIKNGETGFICKSVEDMAHKVEKIRENESARGEILSRARNYITENLTWDRLVDNFLLFKEKA